MRTPDPHPFLEGGAHPAPAGPPSVASPHILVVDDEPQIRTLLAMALRREGYVVTTREDGYAALQDLEREEVSVLLTDLKMPRMSGLELIRAAKSRRPDLASILITAFASTETAVEALRQGADDYLAKPFQLDDLRRVVERALTTRRLASQERQAGDRARDEADVLRVRSLKAETALAEVQHALTLSRADLERRVRDLEFVAELTRLLARETDLERVLTTSSRILATRFHAQGVRIEVVLEDGVRVAQQVEAELRPTLLPALAADLVARAQNMPEGVLRDIVLGSGRPLEALVAALRLSTGPLGGLTVLREAPGHEEPGDLFLLGLVAPTLTMAVEADLQRRAAEQSALDVALGMLEVLEGRGGLQPGHAERVAEVSVRIADRMGLSPRLKRVIEVAARLHDVGEVGVPDSLLQRAGPLSQEERRVVQGHSLVGARLLAPFGEAAAFVRHHHERFDGAGYPDGLKGEEIPVGAAIVGVAEAFDAMTHARPYRPSRTRREALEEVRAQRGRQFVPEVADALLALPTEGA
jgi:response regulator RpfG family c-di-GMP phosphodiesterase